MGIVTSFGPGFGCSTLEAANYLIDNTKRGLPIYHFVCTRITRKRRTDLWEIIKLIHGGSNSSNGLEQRIALCELNEWIQDLLIQLYRDRIDLLAQEIPAELYMDIIQKGKLRDLIRS